MTSLHFTKMHGLGNDFMVVDTTQQPLDVASLPIQRLANHHTGVGFDQLLLIQPSTAADFYCRILNADGSEAEQCGNGLRCVARFLHETGQHTGAHVTIETRAGLFPIHIPDYEHIRVTMGRPRIEERLITLNPLPPVSIISTGNPHAILKVDSIAATDTHALSLALAAHARFPLGVNVGFMEIINPTHIRLKTIERGAGETLACGSNACAAAVAGISNQWLDHTVDVQFQFGKLTIEWQGENQPIHMTGPATRVYSGEL